MSLTPVPTRPIASAPAALAAAENAFGVDLHGAMAAGSTNLVFSPLSIAEALLMAWRGARGATAAQMARVLHLREPDAVGEGQRELDDSLAAVGQADQATLRIANTVWLDSGLTLQSAFTDQLRNAHAAALHTADFVHAADQARARINGVVAEQTAGKIRDLLGPGDVTASTRLVLANAVYLKARWANPFPVAATAPAPFHLADGGTLDVSMMRQTEQLGYARGDGYQAVTVPYIGERLAMTILLPDGPLPPLQAQLARRGLPELLGDVRPARVALALPRFRVTARELLRTVLADLGMPLAFGDQADFTGMTATERLWIDQIVHQAYIDVDEYGTEAAAATATVMRGMAFVRRPDQPIPVTVDRPFLFALTDTTTGAPLFLGHVAKP